MTAKLNNRRHARNTNARTEPARYAITPNGRAALDQWQRARAQNPHRGWLLLGHRARR